MKVCLSKEDWHPVLCPNPKEGVEVDISDELIDRWMKVLIELSDLQAEFSRAMKNAQPGDQMVNQFLKGYKDYNRQNR